MILTTTASSNTHFYILLGIILAIVTILSFLLKGLWNIFSIINAQLEATRSNTQAIQELSGRMQRIESRV